ncbi:MAG: dihydropteroate synthase [Planctomycetia bacterium]|nr:dihydropteroate synthase [Planctomycetia bacterium]
MADSASSRTKASPVTTSHSVSLAAILNVTPDSFSDGGLLTSPEVCVARARRLLAEGADILDIGGESTRPGAVPVDESTELDRVIPVVEQIAQMLRNTQSRGLISVDTYRPTVARAAILAGASMINDVYAASVPGMSELSGEFAGTCDDPEQPEFLDPYQRKIDLCLVHGYQAHRDGKYSPESDMVTEARNFLLARADALSRRGVDRSRILIDPGIGFGKTTEQDLEILRNLHRFRELGYRLLVGVSRKRFLRPFLPPQLPETTRTGASIGVALAILPLIDVLRIHDVAATRQAIHSYLAVHT